MKFRLVMVTYPQNLPPQLLSLLEQEPAAITFEADTMEEAEQVWRDAQLQLAGTATEWCLERVMPPPYDPSVDYEWVERTRLEHGLPSLFDVPESRHWWHALGRRLAGRNEDAPK